MLWVIFVSFLCVFETVSSETYSLKYIYTAISKPQEGFPEFIAMGLLDDMQIDYYDSINQVKESRQTWMKEKMEADNWKKGTKSRKSKEQWFKVNVRILEKRFNETQSPRVLQWMHSCTLDEDNNAEVQGYDQYSYDGRDVYKEVYKPVVTVFAKPVKGKNTLTLTCMATGFYPKTIHIHWNKDRQRLGEERNSTWALPNNDNTFQLRSSLEIDPEEGVGYSCEVLHHSLPEPLFTPWDGVVPGARTSNGIVVWVGIFVPIGLAAAAAGVCVFIYKRRSDKRQK
ncbi:BOLA class I histocompatibility antigen, alpha chain BL3-6-like [Polyodon spathula]|uniref:BOLA class I histocompatibility antigen, alpha chain BL3-6-like n=1 Tax=Polyodon spathula TaxID=7913 RepID=UPI001B7E0FF0|nr:BOLA class I histocompatibility antigen, alpha chain BL3-6-like [Polyodon spathula]